MTFLPQIQSRLSIKTSLWLSSLLAVVIFLFFSNRYQEQKQLLQNALELKARQTSNMMAITYASALEKHNWQAVYEMIQKIKENDQEITNITITDLNQVVRISTDKSQLQKNMSQDILGKKITQAIKNLHPQGLLKLSKPLTFMHKTDDGHLVFSELIQNRRGIPLSYVRTTLSLGPSSNQALKAAQENLMYALALIGIAFVVSFIFTTQVISKRVIDLSHWVHKLVANKPQPLPKRFDTKHSDELNDLAQNFSKMHQNLMEQQQKNLKQQEQKITADLIAGASSTLAHSLKNPLGIISSETSFFAEALKTKSFEELERIHTVFCGELKRIDKTLEQLKQAHPKPVEFSSCDASLLVNLALSRCQKRHDNIEKNLTPNLPEFTADFDLLLIALIDLLQNAIEASPTPKDQITVTVTQNNDLPGICFAIQDQGPGIPEKQMRNLAQPFFTTKKTGTGLGLWNSKRTIEEIHKGSLTIESIKGQGTTVTATVPIKPVE